jgi:hypothetical protein
MCFYACLRAIFPGSSDMLLRRCCTRELRKIEPSHVIPGKEMGFPARPRLGCMARRGHGRPLSGHLLHWTMVAFGCHGNRY